MSLGDTYRHPIAWGVSCNYLINITFVSWHVFCIVFTATYPTRRTADHVYRFIFPCDLCRPGHAGSIATYQPGPGDLVMTRKNRVSLTDLLTEIAAWVIVAGIVGICAAVTIAYYAARFTTGAGA